LNPVLKNGRTSGMTTRSFFRFLLMFLFIGAAPLAMAKITFEGGDGSSIEKAVIIKGADTLSGISAEYEYVRKHFPGSKVLGQRLMNKEPKVYDVIEITDAKGEKRSVYFDITEFYGK